MYIYNLSDTPNVGPAEQDESNNLNSKVNQRLPPKNLEIDYIVIQSSK